jgi:hypothetical protein
MVRLAFIGGLKRKFLRHLTVPEENVMKNSDKVKPKRRVGNWWTHVLEEVDAVDRPSIPQQLAAANQEVGPGRAKALNDISISVQRNKKRT